MSSDIIAKKIDILASGVQSLEGTIRPPFHFRDHGNIETYRFAKPGALQFFVIHFGQTLSHWNVICVLVELGFQFEVMTIFRSILEAEFKIRFVLSGLENEKIVTKQRRYLDRYFRDNERWDSVDRSHNKTPQNQLIEENAKLFREDLKMLREWGIQHSVKIPTEDIEESLNSLYRMSSNFTHGRYPELMHYFEGNHPKFAYFGMIDELNSNAIVDMMILSLDNSIKLLAAVIFRLITIGYIDKYSEIVKWVLFDSGQEGAEIELMRSAWMANKNPV